MKFNRKLLGQQLKKWKGKSPLEMALALTGGLCVCGIILSILLYTRYAFNSDLSYATNLALEEMKQCRLYPDGWCYSTGFYVFSINLLSMPFLLFLKNEVLCRELAMVLLCVLMVLACYKVLYRYSKKMFWTVLALTFLPLTGVVHWYFYDGNYFSFAVMQMLVLWLVKKAMFDENVKQRWIYYVLLVVALIAFTNDGLRNQLTITIPLFAAAFFSFYRKKENKIFEKKHAIFLGTVLLGAALGYVFFGVVLHKVGITAWDSNYLMVNGVTLAQNVRPFFENMYMLYGVKDTEMLSLTGITNAVNAVYCTVSVFVVPVLVAVNMKKITHAWIRFVATFCIWCNILTTFMVIATNAAATAATGQRLLLPIYFNNILLCGCFVGFVAEHILRRYRELILIVVIAIACINQVNYQVQQRVDGKLNLSQGIFHTLFCPEDDSGIAQFLMEHDLTYGYAPFFHAYRTASFTNGNVRIVSFEGDPLQKEAWMASEKWYDVEENSGRCFILVPQETEIDERYYELADEKLYYTANFKITELAWLSGSINYTILVYDKNIHLYPELTAEAN